VGKPYYVLSSKWWEQWKAYTHYKDPSSLSIYDHNEEDGDGEEKEKEAMEAPGPIQNNDLLNEEAQVTKGLCEGQDFVILGREMWELLVEWYGGGPEIMRKAIRRGWRGTVVEVHPLRLLVGFRCVIFCLSFFF